MSRRRAANRAEAIVRGIGAIFMLFVLLAVTQSTPQALNGKSINEAMSFLLNTILGFALLGGGITALGLIVWLLVLKGLRPQFPAGRTPQATTVPDSHTCPKCGSPMQLRKGHWGAFWGCTTYPNCKGKINVVDRRR